MRQESTGQYRNGSVAPVLSHDEPPTMATNIRPKLSNIFTEEEGEYRRVRPQNTLDPDQLLSRELESASKAISAPASEDSFVFVSRRSSFSPGDISESDLGMSPAAMFLSSFSPRADAQPSPDAEGALVAGYRLGPIIGHGGFSIIRRASSAQGGTVAVKIVRRSDLSKQADPARARKRLDHESAVWSLLSHEHILPLFSVAQTLHADFFVTLYCPAGSLFDILKRDGNPALPQDDAGMMFRQVVRGLRYLHEAAGYVHGDMKLENVLVDEMGVCRITDFGMARRIGESDEERASSDEEDMRDPAPAQRLFPTPPSMPSRRSLPVHLSLRRHYGGPRHRTSSPYPTSSMATVAPHGAFQPGSLPYVSPELLLPTSSAPSTPDPAQDIWALGVLLYALLTGRLPFVDSFDPRLQMKILHGVYEVPQGIGRGAERVLQGCLERSVSNRWTIAMVDEVAWGIGWGAAGDDVTPPPELRPSRIPSRSNSGSRVDPKRDTALVDDVESPGAPRAARSRSRPAVPARAKSRSASRHPLSHPYDMSSRLHHHHLGEAYPPPTQPTFAALTSSILRASSTSSSASSASVYNDSAVLMTPNLSHDSERGRLPRPKMHWLVDEPVSRSVSPAEQLLTPNDSLQGTTSTGGLKASAHMLVEPPRWTVEEDGGERLQSARSSRSREPRWDTLQGKARGTRPESMPPAPSPSLTWAHAHDPGQSAASTPRPVPRRTHATRSRSMDPSAGGQGLTGTHARGV